MEFSECSLNLRAERMLKLNIFVKTIAIYRPWRYSLESIQFGSKERKQTLAEYVLV